MSITPEPRFIKHAELLRALDKIDGLAALDIGAASAADVACAVGGIRYWVMVALGQSSRCAEQVARDRGRAA